MLPDINSSDKNRPLTAEELKKLRIKRTLLIGEITIEGLPDSLYAVGCINIRHKAGIEQHPNSYDKICQLLDIIQRRSFTQYQLFLGCLRSTHQQHVCVLLERDGGKTFTIFVEICKYVLLSTPFCSNLLLLLIEPQETLYRKFLRSDAGILYYSFFIYGGTPIMLKAIIRSTFVINSIQLMLVYTAEVDSGSTARCRLMSYGH